MDAQDQSQQDQPIPQSSDDLAEGQTNLYHTDQRARYAVIAPKINPGDAWLAPSGDSVASALALKQDILRNTDDLYEGATNKYYTPDRVQPLIAQAIAPLLDQIASLNATIVTLQAAVESLKPTWIDAIKGGTGAINVLVGISQDGTQTQTLSFSKGVLSSVGPVTRGGMPA